MCRRPACGVGAEFGPHKEWIARGEEVVGRNCVVQDGEAVGLDSLLYEVLFDGVRDGEQV